MNKYRQKLEQLKGQQQQLKELHEKATEDLEEKQDEIKYCEQAQAIIQKVAQLTQNGLKYHLSELVTLALSAVFDDPYEFNAEFVQKRNQTECELTFMREGERINPLMASGGGAVDVASFALRVALHSLNKPATRRILLLDEPMTSLKGGDLPEKGAQMIKQIADKLNLQILYVTHIYEQIESADRVFAVKLKKGVSHVSINT